MVRDAILRRGRCQGGDGKLERRKGLPLRKEAAFFRVVLVCHVSVSNCRSFLSAEKIHTTLRGHKRPNKFYANRHARL